MQRQTSRAFNKTVIILAAAMALAYCIDMAFAQTQTIQVPGPGTVTMTFTPTTSSSSSSGGTSTSSSSGGTTTSSFWVYYNGQMNWGGDYSFGLPQNTGPNYKDTSGKPLSGAYDIAITTNAYGGFQPYAGGTVPLWNFDASPYKYLTFALKPTDPNQSWQVYFIGVGDKTLAPACTVPASELNQYGPTPQAGVWGTYTILLSRLCITGPVYKFALQDQLGKNANLWYLDNIGFKSGP